MIESTLDLSQRFMAKNYEENMEDMPWRQHGYRYKPGVLGLHEEILHYHEYFRPKRNELESRRQIVKRLEAVAKKKWPNASAEMFGSSFSEFCLPKSDIDISIRGNWNGPPPLKTLEMAMVESGQYQDFKILERAVVPIIKATDVIANRKVDVSFNTTNAVKTAHTILNYAKEFPNLRKLVLVIKQFLYMRNLNEVWKGGISSYCLTLMVISFLQLHPREDALSPKANLGVLLIEFFELYGCLFNYHKVAITISNGGSYVRKDALADLFLSSRSILCIQDPCDAHNDVGKGSYGALAVQRAFRQAYLDLAVACGPTATFIDPKHSILGRIIKISKDERPSDFDRD